MKDLLHRDLETRLSASEALLSTFLVEKKRYSKPQPVLTERIENYQITNSEAISLDKDKRQMRLSIYSNHRNLSKHFTKNEDELDSHPLRPLNNANDFDLFEQNIDVEHNNQVRPNRPIIKSIFSKSDSGGR